MTSQGGPRPTRSGLKATARLGEGATPRRRPAKDAPARPAARSRQEARQAHQDEGGAADGLRRALMAAIAVASVLLALVLGLAVASHTSAFTIETVETDATEHLSSDVIQRLAGVGDGATLLNIDEDQVTKNLQRNPWVGSVRYVREFPGTLRIEVTERTVAAVVVMSSGTTAWCLGDNAVWIQPLSIDQGDYGSIKDAALAQAQSMGTLLITDVPASVSPVAGYASTDEPILAVESYRSQFSSELNDQIVSYSAKSSDSISCTLSSGVEVSLGAPNNVASKEEVILSVLQQYSGKVTYINVRVPTKPSYRTIDSDTVQQGTGTTGASAIEGKPSGSVDGEAKDGEAKDGEDGSTPADGSSASDDGEGDASDGTSDDASGSDEVSSSSGE